MTFAAPPAPTAPEWNWKLSLVLSGILFALWCHYVFGSPTLLENAGANFVGRDFYNKHTGGAAAWSGNAGWLYDMEAYTAHGRARGLVAHYSFSYPPHALFAFAPFGLLPYKVGLAAWSFGSLGAFALVLRGLRDSVRPDILLFALICPAALISLFWGQTGLWAVALLGGGLLLCPTRPLLAGVLFGILTVKPQLGLVLAPMLLVTGQWRVIASASVTALTLLVASVLVFGVEPWTAYATDTAAYQMSLAQGRIGLFDYMVLTPYRMVTLIGGSPEIAQVVQLAIGLPLLGVALWVGRWTDWLSACGLVLLVTCVLSPYFAIYDLTLAALAMALMWSRVGGVSKTLLAGSALAPMSMGLAGFGLHPAWTGVFTLTLVLCAVSVLRDLYLEQANHRHVVAWLRPVADVFVDAKAFEAVDGLRAAQEVVDPNALVAGPGAALVVPEGVLAGRAAGLVEGAVEALGFEGAEGG